MEHTCLFEERVPLTPVEISKVKADLSVIILDKLRKKLEGRCSRNGYVIPGSLELLSRSMGQSEKGTFTGDWVFIVQAQGSVIYPPDGAIINATVSRKNKAGMYLIYKEAVRIMIPRDLYIGDEEYEAVNVGDRISVEIKKSRFQVNDREILSVGLFRGKVDAEMEAGDAEDAGDADDAEAEGENAIAEDAGDAEDAEDAGDAEDAEETNENENESEENRNESNIEGEAEINETQEENDNESSADEEVMNKNISDSDAEEEAEESSAE
jgi:hypothetical protein